MDTVNRLFLSIQDNTLPSRQVREYMSFGQSERFFHLSVAKKRRLDSLKEHFSHKKITKIFLGNNLKGIAFRSDGMEVSCLEKDSFRGGIANLDAQCAKLEGSIVIYNNNDIDIPIYMDVISRCKKTIFIAWDWDNHHWLDLSTFLAAHSDVYAPAHHENLYLLSRYSANICGPVYCASVQWSRAFLADHLSEMLSIERSKTPLGMHIPYSPFSFRLQVITTLNQHYPSIGFSDRTFHVRTPLDRLREWSSHKMHWIVPVLNDVPIRIFDALATGGIPIVPDSLQLLPPVQAINRKHILFYTPLDILSPQKLVEQANTLFDEGGADGIVERHRFALDNHHGDTRIWQMLNAAAELFQFTLPAHA